MERYAIPGVVLMENAARGCCDVLLQAKPAGPIAVLCGAGNNGGDGYAIARRLSLLGYNVRVLSLKPIEQLTGDAAINAEIVRRMEISRVDIPRDASPADIAAHLVNADWLIDAMLGTGVTGDPRPPYDAAISAANAHDGCTFAVDLPSGLNGDTGRASEPTIVAGVTCTFVAPKRGLVAESAKPFVGELHVVDIGAPQELLAEVLSGK